MSQKKCNHCGLEKDEEEFNWRYKTLGIRHPICRECAHSFNKDYYGGMQKRDTYSKLRKEQSLPVRPQGNMFTSTFLLILVRTVEKQIPVSWSFTMLVIKIRKLLGWYREVGL